MIARATGADPPQGAQQGLGPHKEARERQPAMAERLIEKARRRAKVGWNVGQHERVLHLGRPQKREEGDGGVRGSLHFQHQRRAHFRLLPSNKVTFVRQATAAVYRVQA